MNPHELYLHQSLRRLKAVIEDMGCRPILFIGSGLSRRYISGPSWIELLEYLVKENPILDQPFGFYYQKAGNYLPAVASLLEDDYQSHAWSKYETNLFPKELYDYKNPKGIFLKYKISSLFTNLLENYQSNIETNPYSQEIELLTKVEPHAVITTNYDQFIETVFTNFCPIIGQQIIRKPLYSDIGEILKIHGCVSTPDSIVISDNDYKEFLAKKKYLSAKLLTYFIEHPLIILGYSISDVNIKNILSDISEMVPEHDDELVENIWFIDWRPVIDSDKRPPEEKVIDLGNGKSIRINYIILTNFSDLYETISQPVAVKQVNVKLLRALMANVYDIVKNKSANSSIQVNIATLNGLSDEGNLLNILGFGAITNPEIIPTLYPFSLTDVAKELGYNYWYHANELIKKVKNETNFDIKSTNNEYHLDVGLKGYPNHHYSQKAIQLLKLVQNGDPYSVTTDKGKLIAYPGNHE